jgi:hypothetical protein
MRRLQAQQWYPNETSRAAMQVPGADTFPAMEFDLAAATAILERTPPTLRALLHGLPDAWTSPNEGPDTWSPYDIVGHLIHGERTDWIPRARIILDRTGQPFERFDRFAQFRESRGKTLAQLLDEFDSARTRNLETLREWRLTDAELDLPGTHPELGAVTLRQLLATWAAHDLNHLHQMARVMAVQYRDAVGPWRQYLGVMHR